MFAHIRFLILTIFVIILTVMDSQNSYSSAAPEKVDSDAAALQEEFLSLKNVEADEDEDSRQQQISNKCTAPGGPCNGACNCCQPERDAYNCTLSEKDGQKYCRTTRLPVIWCPFSPIPCKLNNGLCKRDCDCCQTDHNRNPRHVTCSIDQSPNATTGYCLPQPYVTIICHAPLPPPPTKP